MSRATPPCRVVAYCRVLSGIMRTHLWCCWGCHLCLSNTRLSCCRGPRHLLIAPSLVLLPVCSAGCCVVTGTPQTKAAVTTLAERISAVQTTIYGKTFEVAVREQSLRASLMPVVVCCVLCVVCCVLCVVCCVLCVVCSACSMCLLCLLCVLCVSMSCVLILVCWAFPTAPK
jgi:hypothetical protein